MRELGSLPYFLSLLEPHLGQVMLGRFCELVVGLEVVDVIGLFIFLVSFLSISIRILPFWEVIFLYIIFLVLSSIKHKNSLKKLNRMMLIRRKNEIIFHK
ncbi:MAG: hypothetical protein SNJ64_04145 [Endomicrobiia bacterium]